MSTVANVTDDVLLRAGWGEDIRRPDFDNPVALLGLKSRGFRIQNDFTHLPTCP